MLIKKANLPYSEMPYMICNSVSKEEFEQVEETILNRVFEYMSKKSIKQMYTTYSGGHDDGSIEGYYYIGTTDSIILPTDLDSYNYTSFFETDRSTWHEVIASQIDSALGTVLITDKNNNRSNFGLPELLYHWLPSFDGEPACQGVVVFDLETTSVHIYNQESIQKYVDADTPDVYKIQPDTFQIDKDSILSEFLEEPDSSV